MSKSGKNGEWSLTPEAFDKLLAAFSDDRDEAARQYQALRIKLIRFFEWRSVTLADDRTDEVFNRVARRIEEGQQVDNVVAYSFRVAYLVFLETIKEPELIDFDPDTMQPPSIDPQFEDDEDERRHRCLERCLAALTTTNRKLMLSYFSEAGRAKIELRKKWAEQLKISLDALRIRVFRMRKDLRNCVSDCMDQLA